MTKERILNVGCGNSTYGTDFLDLYPKRKEIKKYNADADKIPYPDNTFDEIISVCLFEHLRNPKFFLEECYRVLKKSGKIILITDNALYWGWKFNRAHLGSYDGHHGESDFHYALYTKKHLINHFEKANFKILNVKYQRHKPIRFIPYFISLFHFYDEKFPRIKIEATK